MTMIILIGCATHNQFVNIASLEETRIRSYPIPDHGALELYVPVSWKDEVRQPTNSLPPTIVFTLKLGLLSQF